MSMQDDLDKWYPDTELVDVHAIALSRDWTKPPPAIDTQLDELAELAELWKDHRDGGNTPYGIKAGMLEIIKQIEVE